MGEEQEATCGPVGGRHDARQTHGDYTPSRGLFQSYRWEWSVMEVRKEILDVGAVIAEEGTFYMHGGGAFVSTGYFTWGKETMQPCNVWCVSRILPAAEP